MGCLWRTSAFNAAPNEGDGMSFGFDGTSLVYAYFTDNAEAADPGHPILPDLLLRLVPTGRVLPSDMLLLPVLI